MPDLKWTYCPEEIEMMQQINGGIMGNRQVTRLKALAVAPFVWFFFMVMFAYITFADNSFSQSQSIQKLLPSNLELPPWRQNGQSAIYKGKNLFEYINGGAEI